MSTELKSTTISAPQSRQKNVVNFRLVWLVGDKDTDASGNPRRKMERELGRRVVAGEGGGGGWDLRAL